ncbi:MAG: efflux RND transporter periplasmic adaptor subunit [Pseudomonadota bacterium]
MKRINMKYATVPSGKLLFAGCLAMAVLLCGACKSKNEKPKAKPPVPVTVAQSVEKEVPVQLKAIGNIEAYASVAIKSQISGQIMEIHFDEGSDVEKGALLISIDPAPFLATLHQYEAALAKNRAQEKFAREQAARYAGLLQEGIVTKDQVDLLRTTAEALSAAVSADLAAIKSAKIQLDYCAIRSPISGRTGALALHAGNLTKANDVPIVTINQIRPIYVTFSMPERTIADVKKAMAAGELKIEAAIPDERGHTEAGTLSFLDNAVNSATGMIKMKGLFTNTAKKLWPGQFTDVIMTLGSLKNAVVIPTGAIQTSQQGQFVYIVKPDKTVEVRGVAVGLAIGGESVIDKGIVPGETVVIEGQLRLVPGATIDAKTTPGEKAP